MFAAVIDDTLHAEIRDSSHKNPITNGSTAVVRDDMQFITSCKKSVIRLTDVLWDRNEISVL
jgi:hypothetical protein